MPPTAPFPTITAAPSLDDGPLRAELERLLEDAVASGASVGYHAPLDPPLNRRYWDGVARLLAEGDHRLLLARDEDGALLGSVQLALCGKPNGVHRAEVQKLLVHTAHRRRGVASALMAVLEETARGLGRTLLVLDTLKGDVGEPFYERSGWQRAGIIPGYTLEADGAHHDVILYYRHL